MELTALIQGLSALTKKNYDVFVFSDSAYLIDCLRKGWYKKWLSNGWLKSDKKPVENKGLWEKLISYLPNYDFRFYLIKGHLSAKASDASKLKEYDRFKKNNGDGFSLEEFLQISEKNQRADELANLGIEEVRA